MAGDWIKMRSSLLTNPKVSALCKLIENSKPVGKKLSTGFGGALREIVTRDVTRDVTVASLFRVWCAANDHTTDGVWHGIELDHLDHVAGIPGFGDMMEVVGWAVVDADNHTVTFPNFLEYNAPAKEGRGSSAAERQRRYREKNRANRNESNVTRDVTDNVTRDTEKRREEKNTKERETGENRIPFLETRSTLFLEAWERWKVHSREKGKPINGMSEETQLKSLFSAYPSESEAINAIYFSIDKNWANLDLKSSHNRKDDKPERKQQTKGEQLAAQLQSMKGKAS